MITFSIIRAAIICYISKTSIYTTYSYHLFFDYAGAIATGSMTMVLAKGKTLEEALEITEDDIVEGLGGLPENKKHCSNLGVQGLRNAINNYKSNEKN